MTVVQCVQLKGPAQVHADKLRPHVILRETVVNTQVLNPGGKPLLQPQVGPPVLEAKSHARRSSGESQYSETACTEKWKTQLFKNLFVMSYLEKTQAQQMFKRNNK